MARARADLSRQALLAAPDDRLVPEHGQILGDGEHEGLGPARQRQGPLRDHEPHEFERRFGGPFVKRRCSANPWRLCPRASPRYSTTAPPA